MNENERVCPSCGHTLVSLREERFCPRCGNPLSRRALISSRSKAALAGLLCILLAGGVLFALLAVAGKYLEAAVAVPAPTEEPTVTEPPLSAPESASFDMDEYTVRVGESFVPRLVVLPEDAFFDEISYEYDKSIISFAGGSFTALNEGRTKLTALISGGKRAQTEVFVYRYGSDLLADLVIREGERDDDSRCWYRALDKSEVREGEISITKYVELIYFPEEQALTVCCDIYDPTLRLYYETNVIFIRGDSENASVTFRCSLEAAQSGGTVPLSGGAAVDVRAGGSIAIPEYSPGDPIPAETYSGSPEFRGSAEAIMSAMAKYSLEKLAEKWGSLGLPFTMGETLGFAED